jgi:hypothetical protein
VRHQPELFPPDAPDAVVRRWLRHVGPDLVRDLFRLRFALWRAGSRGRAVSEQRATNEEWAETPDDLLERWAKARRVMREEPAISTGDLAVGGHDLMELGLEPGPVFKEILESLLDRVLDDPALNEKAALLAMVREEWLDE